MNSVSGKYWEEIQVEKRLIDKAKIDLNLNDIQSKLIISRNFTKDEIFLIKNNTKFNNPFIKDKDFLLACELIKESLQRNNKIMVIGDYDVDGCVSTSLMVNFLKANHAKVDYFIPDRFKDGYGMSKKLIMKLISQKKPQLIIFLDVGSNSHDAIDYAKNLKIKTLIIDHHNVNSPYPLANVFLNPKKDLNNEFNYLCTSYLTYLFIDLFLKTNNSKISLEENLIYVLLATVADVMPLRGLNLYLAKKTLKNFDLNNNFILKYLFKTFKFKRNIEIEDLSFLIAPIFNSAGRLENANQIVDLLTTNSHKQIIKILKKIIILNNKRKLIEKRSLNELNFKQIENQNGVLFIYDPNISEGIIGIIASKIKDQFNKPCIVFTKSKNVLKGSARSTPEFDIGKYINLAVEKKIINNGGGHNLAAGVSLYKSKTEIFKKFLNNFYLKNKSICRNFFISKISLSSINKNLLENINLLGPFGNLNSNPIFLIENIKIHNPVLIKNNFISCYIKSTNKTVKAISFNSINSKISLKIMSFKKPVNILVRVKENKWNNKSSIQLELIDIIETTINT
tara:strand:+ start:54 stop:1751 length:1698 start_codon:yes stop_codon:yes gene_type:complete